jgi:hypothetical protein
MRTRAIIAAGAAMLLAMAAAPAEAGAVHQLCSVGQKLCHGSCIPKRRACVQCSAGTWYCNGRCIPKHMACAVTLSR